MSLCRPALSVLVLVLVSCAPAAEDPSHATSSQAPQAVSVESDIAAINELRSERFEAFQNAPTPAAKADAYVRGVAEDAIWMPPHSSLVSGRDAIREWANEFFSNWTFEIAASTDVTVKISGDLAVRRWVSMGTYAPQGAGEPVQFHQKFVEVLTRQEDGSWLISIQMWSSNNNQPDIWR
jgi:uncharacterized protein (TIGR02246 family)